MADHSYDVNDDGAPMDYSEHERTYSLFLAITKWGVIFNVALLLALAVGFFMGGGFIGGLLAFLVLLVVSKIFA